MPKFLSFRRILKYFGLQSIKAGFSNWYNLIKEPFTGAWQRNIVLDSKEALLRNSAIYACVTGISSDIAKMRIKLDRNESGIWTEITENEPWLPVVRKPNHYQNRIQFLRQWIISKLLHGNTYILKERDKRGIVNALYVLDPQRVVPLVASDGEIYYSLSQDNLSHVEDASVTVPASEIIHDRMSCLYHPLIGIPPIYACVLSGTLANKIQNHSVTFFLNRAMPGGMLTAPGIINKQTAERLKEDFEKNYSGENIGRLLVLGDGLEFKLAQITAQHAQLAEQFDMSIEDIARAFHYPLFKLGGPLPPYAGNVEALITSYYTDCLQELIESVELCLDEGLQLPKNMGTELDLDNLLRMDTAALYETNNKAVVGGWLAPDEARFKANYKGVDGGSTPYLQQQNYSLAALAKRDAQENPFLPPESSFLKSEDEIVDKDSVRDSCFLKLKIIHERKELAA